MMKVNIKMPLIKSKSKEALKKNISELVKSGKKVEQAVAIAYSIKRKQSKKGIKNAKQKKTYKKK